MEEAKKKVSRRAAPLTVMVSFRLPLETLRAIDEAAEGRKMNRSEYIKYLIHKRALQ